MSQPAGKVHVLSGIIVTHGGVAAALRQAAADIAGDVARVEVVSNEGLSTEQLAEQVRAALERAGRDGVVVFTDLGSCANACRTVLRDYPGVRLLTGVNLPMLVDFVLRRGDLDLEALVERLLQRGRSSIQELKGT